MTLMGWLGWKTSAKSVKNIAGKTKCTHFNKWASAWQNVPLAHAHNEDKSLCSSAQSDQRVSLSAKGNIQSLATQKAPNKDSD